MTFSPLAAEELDARPDRFIQAARELANDTGSAAFTVAQVTAQAELSLKSFYRCFRSKDELLLALLAADSRLGAEVLRTRIGDRKGADGLHAYVVELFDLLSVPGALGYAGVLVREYLRLNEHHGEEQLAALAPLLDLLAGYLESEHPHRDALTMFGVLLGGIHEVVLGRATDSRELAEYLHDFCARGVRGR
jgi:AcrR family transcriptional regulator